MPKVEVLRKGSSYPVKMDRRVADALVKSGRFSYAEEAKAKAKVSKSKRAPKADNAASRSAAAPEVKAVQEEAKPEARPQPEPVTAKTVAPTRRAAVPATRDELQAMTKAELKALGTKLGADLLPSDSKEQFVQKIVRYMRRDMRAER